MWGSPCSFPSVCKMGKAESPRSPTTVCRPSKMRSSLSLETLACSCPPLWRLEQQLVPIPTRENAESVCVCCCLGLTCLVEVCTTIVATEGRAPTRDTGRLPHGNRYPPLRNQGGERMTHGRRRKMLVRSTVSNQRNATLPGTLAHSGVASVYFFCNFKDVRFYPRFNFGHFWAALSKISGFHPTRFSRQFWADPIFSAVESTFLAEEEAQNLDFLPHPKFWPFLGPLLGLRLDLYQMSLTPNTLETPSQHPRNTLATPSQHPHNTLEHPETH